MSNIKQFDFYEIASVKIIDKKTHACEICKPDEADFWTLYGHIPGEGIDAFADCETKEQCEELLQRITGKKDYILNTL